ncbi:hypothetical protein EVAR_35809_1 [Eumeta japonica]|uniref:Uncharacterized protein n=1 Tax=Eumeta variegata TaxID=151549 RepID=A0A4C1WQK7_EUMVA|nr:hypothetical protein EVAR_35809_1 [Eumeta japonica]
MLPAAFDKDVKAYGLTAVPFLCFFGGFAVRESRIHPVCPGTWTAHNGFFLLLPHPSRKGKTTKKNRNMPVCLQPLTRKHALYYVRSSETKFWSALRPPPSRFTV